MTQAVVVSNLVIFSYSLSEIIFNKVSVTLHDGIWHLVVASGQEHVQRFWLTIYFAAPHHQAVLDVVSVKDRDYIFDCKNPDK